MDQFWLQFNTVPFADFEKAKLAKFKVRMLILATNNTESTARLPVLKSPDFLTSSIFLKKSERIEDLFMIFSLLVHAGLEHKTRLLKLQG